MAVAPRKKQRAGVTNPAQRLTTDHVVEIGGSECSVGLECLLNIVRALGMGSCLSVEGAGASSGALPYALAAAAVSASASASDNSKRGSPRKKIRRNPSIESKLDMWLRKVPGRLFSNGSSEVASLFSKQGKKGVNQDAMIVWEVSPS